MRWLKKSSDTPQLLGLSPIEAEDSLKKYRAVPEHQVYDSNKKINDQCNQSIVKSRTGKTYPIYCLCVCVCEREITHIHK